MLVFDSVITGGLTDQRTDGWTKALIVACMRLKIVAFPIDMHEHRELKVVKKTGVNDGAG